MPDPLPGSGPISIELIAEFYEGSSSNISLQNLASNLEPEPEANIAMSLFYASACTAFLATTEARDPCELDPESTYYHNGSGTYPVAGDNVFTDSSCSQALEGGGYKMESGNVMVIGEGGEVSETFSC